MVGDDVEVNCFEVKGFHITEEDYDKEVHHVDSVRIRETENVYEGFIKNVENESQASEDELVEIDYDKGRTSDYLNFKNFTEDCNLLLRSIDVQIFKEEKSLKVIESFVEENNNDNVEKDQNRLLKEFNNDTNSKDSFDEDFQKKRLILRIIRQLSCIQNLEIKDVNKKHDNIISGASRLSKKENEARWDLRQERGACEFLDWPVRRKIHTHTGNILVFGWVGGKHACVDLTGVSPLVGLSSRGLTVGETALKAASCKVTKHEKTRFENQHVFIPFAFDTFGFLAPEAVELLTRVQRIMNSNVMTPSVQEDLLTNCMQIIIHPNVSPFLVCEMFEFEDNGIDDKKDVRFGVRVLLEI
ncbi:hypothetical protein Tco_1210679 [Tanacetum coccineum]